MSHSPASTENSVPILKVRDLKVHFPVKRGLVFQRTVGVVKAVDGVDIEINHGETLGLVGESGSGKTTLGRAIIRLNDTAGGSISYSGQNVLALRGQEMRRLRKNIGMVFQHFSLFDSLTVLQNVALALPPVSSMAGLAERIERVSADYGLPLHPDVPVVDLSVGERQRIEIVRCLLQEPQLLIMDEPTVGIDPIQVVETRNLIKGFGGDQTVILSTHILPEVSMVCSRVIIIHEGQVVAIDRPDNLSERLRATEKLEVDIRGPASEVMPAIRDMDGVLEVNRVDRDGVGIYLIETPHGADLRERISNLVHERGWGLLRLQPIQMSLEEIFLRLTDMESATK